MRPEYTVIMAGEPRDTQSAGGRRARAPFTNFFVDTTGQAAGSFGTVSFIRSDGPARRSDRFAYFAQPEVPMREPEVPMRGLAQVSGRWLQRLTQAGPGRPRGLTQAGPRPPRRLTQAGPRPPRGLTQAGHKLKKGKNH